MHCSPDFSSSSTIRSAYRLERKKRYIRQRKILAKHLRAVCFFSSISTKVADVFFHVKKAGSYVSSRGMQA